MANKKDFEGVTEKDLENKAQDSLNSALDNKKQELSQQEQSDESTESEQQTQQVQQEQKGEDATDNEQGDKLTEYDNVLKNTYGVTDEELQSGISPEKARKLAKSWASMQSKATTAQQEANQASKQKQQFDELLQNNPELYKHAQAAMNGQSYENPQKQGTSHNGQPDSTQGKLDNSKSVNEDTLVSEGYLSSDQLEGLDDIDRRMAVKEAQLDRRLDQKAENFQNKLSEQQQNLQKQQEEQQIKQVNSDRLTEGLDEFVRSTGYPIGELDDDTFEQIKNEAFYDREPSDPRKIKQDAFQVAAQRVLKRQGLWNNDQQQPTQKKQIMSDTGVSPNKAQQEQNRNKSISDLLSEQALKDANAGGDPKQKFRQKIS